MLPKLILALNDFSPKEWTLYNKYLLMQTKESTDTYQIFAKLRVQKNTLADFVANTWRRKYTPTISEKTFLNILSKLYLWLEEWIVYNDLKNDKVKSGIQLVKHYNRRGLYKLANSKAKQVQLLIDSEADYSPERDYRQHQLYYYQFYSDNPIKNQNPELVFDLVDSYLVCRNYADSLMRSQVEYWSTIRPIDPTYLEKIRAAIDPEIHTDILQTFIQLMKDSSLQDLLNCFQYLKGGKVKREDDFFTILTMFVLSISLKLWHKRLLTDSALLAEMWEFALEQKVLMNAGTIPFLRFTTIVNTLGPFFSYDWTNAFIEKWASYVDEQDTPTVIRYAKARNYFHHEKYEESLGLMQEVNIRFIYNRDGIHRLGIMLYYETRHQNYSLLIDAIDRYQAYLRRRSSNMSESKLSKEKNFLKAIKYLLNNECTIDGLSRYFPASNTLWLTTKVKEMGQLRG